MVAGPGRMGKRPEGRSFHHGKFVMKLREMAMRERNVRVVEATAKELLKRGGSGQLVGVECVTGEKKETQRVCISCSALISSFEPRSLSLYITALIPR
jgi:glycine/D-amino acid oxidase-like deaminating enzyme